MSSTVRVLTIVTDGNNENEKRVIHNLHGNLDMKDRKISFYSIDDYQTHIIVAGAIESKNSEGGQAESEKYMQSHRRA